jgi:hypothetical protein
MDRYFGLNMFDRPILMLVEDGLEEEREWVDRGDWDPILPHRRQLAQVAANGFSHHEARIAGEVEREELLRDLHEATAKQRNAAS